MSKLEVLGRKISVANISSLNWGLALYVLITEMRRREYFPSSLTRTTHKAHVQIAVLFTVMSTCQQHNKSAGCPAQQEDSLC